MTLVAIIRSRVPFSEEFIPSNLVGRDVEITTIRKFLEPLCHNEPTACNLFITGNVGVGKTALTRFVLLNIPSKVNYVYVQLKTWTTTFSLLTQIAKGLVPEASAWRRSTEEFMIQLAENLKGRPGLIILDEMEKVPSGTLAPILHAFCRESWVSFILISRIPTALDGLPVDTKESLRCRNLHLRPYTKLHLFNILKQRAELALHSGSVSDVELDSIAEYAGCFGSARLAIDILMRACEEAEYQGADKVSIEHVREAIRQSEESTVTTMLLNLPSTHKLALKAINRIERLRQTTTFQEVIKEWQRLLTTSNLSSFSKWKFYDVIADLKKLGLVETVRCGGGRGKGVYTILKLSEQFQKALSGLTENQTNQYVKEKSQR